MGRARSGLAVQAALVCMVVLGLRLPFLNQAIQGDDFYYLKGAEHAQIDPLHPNHARYVFLGEMVDMRGHPHPPLDVWYLASILALTGNEREVPYHAAYLLWSLVAALSVLALARRFVPERAIAATLLFCTTLPFIINGTSLESDLPLVACWMAAAACFVLAADRRSTGLAAACFAWGALAGLAAYQAVVLVPILAIYASQRQRRWLAGWIAICGPLAAVAAYQAFERVSSGAVPAGVLAGYLATHGFSALVTKVKSAVALAVHAGWIVFPVLVLVAFRRLPLWAWPVAAAAGVAGIFYDPNPLFWVSLATGVVLVLWCAIRTFGRDPDTAFLAGWSVLFFAAALVLFFAGSARYLLPMSAPVAILVARHASRRWLYAAAAANATLGLLLAAVNARHWGAYRDIATSLARDAASRRVWVNGEWGLRHYLEQEGALPLENGRAPRPGDLVVSTAYAGPVQAPLATLSKHEITSAIPLRLVGLGAKSGYSSISFGLRPFDISRVPIDVVRVAAVSERQAKAARITTGTPEAADQIVSGVYNNDRWMSNRAAVILKRPDNATRIVARLYIPPNSPARTFTLSMNGDLLTREIFPGPGQYSLAAVAPKAAQATVVVTADRTFTAPPDERSLSAILLEVGFE